MAKIARKVFQYIEYELYSYMDTKQEIENQREAILYGTEQIENGGRPPGYISDTTGSKAVQLLSSPALFRMDRLVRAVDLSLDLLGDHHRELFKMRYILRFSQEQICMEMPCSDRSYYRYRREIVEMVAGRLGFCVGEVFYE